jgi:hypothetical protein
MSSLETLGSARRTTSRRRAAAYALVAMSVLIAGAALPASAGTVSIAWDPVNDPDLAGYRIYYGTSPANYTQNVDVGNTTSHTVTGLANCQDWYFGIKAYDTAGNESVNYSNEVSGWPRPEVTLTSPSSAEQGRRLDVTVSGTNFRSGAGVDFGDPNITINSVTVNGCNSLVADITVGSAAAVGGKNVDVINPDNTFGTGVGVFNVDAAVAPSVASTDPADGATGVTVTIHPDVVFDEAMDPATITTATVRLLDSGSQPVTQAPGSPVLSPDGLTATITPAADLTQGATYRIQVVGGASGAKDLAGNPLASTWTQPTGFTTAADSTPPSISNVQAVNVDATNADVTWDTDEPADSLVYYREQGQTGYQQTTLDTTLVTAHSVTLQGLVPSTTYEYHVESTDGAGNTATSSPDQTFTTAASPYTYLRFEAEAGALTSPVRQGSDAAAFQGAYIDTPNGTSTGTATNPSGTAVFGFNVPTSGTWYVWVRLYGVNGSSNSWFESVDGGGRQTIETSSSGEWQWVAGRSYVLTAGLHDFELGGHESRARADRVLITDDPGFVPTEQPGADNTPPGPLASFNVTPADQRNDLDWINPIDGDFVRTVVRYRTDGRYPTSPEDGFLVADRPALPASSDSFAHTNLTNGISYKYSAFAIDVNGNVSPVTQAEGTPFDSTPPSDVNNARRTDTR